MFSQKFPYFCSQNHHNPHFISGMKHLYMAVFTAGLMLFSSCKNDNSTHMQLEYPQTERGTVAEPYFGTMVEDPYRWLEYENDENVKKWVVAQNKVTQDYLAEIPFRAGLHKRLKEIWNYARQSAPSREGENYFYTQNDGLQNQSVIYVKKGLDGKPRLFLDPNTLSTDGTTAISSTSVSKDGKFYAFGISKGGSDWNEIFVRDVETGENLSDHLEWVKFSGATWWKNGFFYTRYPEPKKGSQLSASNTNAKIYYHKIGTTQDKDTLVFEYPQNPMIGMGIDVTEDENYALIYLTKGASDNAAVYWKDLNKADMKFQPLVNNYDNTYRLIDNEGSDFLFMTDKDAPKMRLIKIDAKNPDPKKWRILIPEQEGVMQSASVMRGKLLVTYLKDAQSQVKVYSAKGDFLYDVQLSGIGSVGGFGGKKQDSLLFYTFTSFIMPTSIYKYNVDENRTELYWSPSITFPFVNYETKQVFYTSKDGTKIPMFLTHKKGLKLNGENPTYLYAYGGFNINILPAFSPNLLPFLEKGGVYAVANLRGGGEFGEEWHKAGMRDKKQNVFDDFIAAAEFLIKEKYTSNQKLCISGRSNGGLLVGACMTQRPDLYKVALPAVGVMDMLRFHKFTIGHAWTTEYGCADSSVRQFEVLKAYSPLHNLKKDVNYPATLVTTADHDDRVVPAHSYKFAAQLQHAHKGGNPVLIRIDTSAGHGSGKSTTKVIDEWADVWAFVFRNLGMKY